MSRAEGVALWAVGVPLVHAALPIALSTKGARRGWKGGRPGFVNAFGLTPIVVGAAWIAWACAEHFEHAADGWAIAEGPPEYVLREGPYRYTRNPLYLGELSMWMGWTVLFGSAPVAGGLAVLTAGVRIMVPREERALEARFGDEYREYVIDVPRFFLRPPDR